MAVNVGVAAYYGYKAYKKGGWKKAAVAVGIGLVGGAAFKAGKVAYKAYRLKKVFKAPAHVNRTLAHITSKNGSPPRGYAGGRTYGNKPKSKKAWKLPKRDTYREYDVHPKVKGRNRGGERLVIGSQGRAYYSKNHYKTFRRIR
ncbi:ribonuclease domain-containing protein [Niallia sp. 03133]|uniref:ribonuclease domain-containing protein n=1 Tax=Niallia sp. 03133 TaxID=3458060 RepID=UPI0040448F6D